MSQAPTPRVSIILTTLNSARYLERSIASCFEQTFTDLELLVVDGGSTDGTLGILSALPDPRLRLIHQPDNSGKLPGALNLGMSQARGAFITWTQDDCWYEKDAIQAMVDFLERHAGVALVYADYWDVDEQGKRLRYQRVNPPELLTEQLADDVVRQCFLFRREVWEAVGPQEPRYFPVHEVPWRLEVARRYRIEPLHRPLMSYLVHEHSLTGLIGPWRLQRCLAVALRDAGYMDRVRYRARLAEIDLNQAYEELVQRGRFWRFQGLTLRAVLRRPSLARDPGLWKLLALSLSPRRGDHQVDLQRRWREADAAEQARAAALGQGEEGAR